MWMDERNIRQSGEGLLRWFGHVCTMNEERMAGKVFVSEVEGKLDE